MERGILVVILASARSQKIRGAYIAIVNDRVDNEPLEALAGKIGNKLLLARKMIDVADAGALYYSRQSSTILPLHTMS